MISFEATKINIGCGYDKRPGFLNVDMDSACAPDVLITDNSFSELPRKHFDMLISYDVLEHIHRSETTNALLEWADLMQLGGAIDLETSNVVAIAEMMKVDRTYERHATYTTFMFGNQVHAGDYHHTGFTDITLRVEMMAAGFEVDELVEREIWLYRLKGRKVLDWTALLDAGDELSDREFVTRAYMDALDRAPEDPFFALEIAFLEQTNDRRALLKKLFASQERRLRVAQKLGL